MRKILSSLAIVIASILAADAQTPSTGEYYGETGFGVTVGWDLNSPSTNLDYMGNGSGLSFGAIYDIPLYRSLYFEPGLLFYYNTMLIDGLSPEGGSVEVATGSVRNTGFRIPLRFGYRIELVDDIALSIFTGPQLNIGLSAKRHLKTRLVGEQKEELWPSTNLYGNGFHRLDAQWLFGVRLHYQDNFFAEIGGGVGMTNLLVKDHYSNSHLRRNTFTIGVGYMF